MRCEAKSKRSGERCKGQAITGRHTCRMHGGTCGSGPASPTFKTGIYSKDMPTRLAARYEAALSDPDLLKLHDSIAAVRARAGELWGKLDQGGGSDSWFRVGRAFKAFKSSQGDPVKMLDALAELEAAVDAGYREAGVWRELWDVLERHARFVAAERKLAVAEATAIQVDEALTLVGALVSIVRTRVKEVIPPEDSRKVLSAISRDVEGLLHREPKADAGPN